MSDHHYDIGSYHPSSEARTLYSGSTTIDGEPSYYNTNSRSSTQSAVLRSRSQSARDAIKSVSPPIRTKLVHSSLSTASSPIRGTYHNTSKRHQQQQQQQQQQQSRTSNTTATNTTSSSNLQRHLNAHNKVRSSSSSSSSNLRKSQQQQRAAAMYNSSATHHSTSSTTRDHRQEHTMDSRTYSDGRNDDLFLTWRLDPEESLSDWTIIVRSIGTSGIATGKTSTNDDRADTYNNDDSFSQDSNDNNTNSPYNVRYYYVHKAQLGVGPRRSEYFARLFRSKRTTATTPSNITSTTKHSTSGGKTKTSSSTSTFEEKESRIELKPSAAMAFPLMLDYIYSPPGVPVRVSTETAVALRHLATCFGIRDLFSEVTSFIHHDLNLDTSFIYLREASIYNHEKLLSAAVKLCATKFQSLKISQLVNLEPRLFQSIVTSPNCNCDSEILSSRVATYLRCRPGSYNLNFLQSITSPSKMPRIASDDSLFLISILAQFGAIPPKIRAKNSRSVVTRNVAEEEDDDDDDDDNNNNNHHHYDEEEEQESVENDNDEEQREGKQPQRGPTLYERCAVSAVEAVKRAVTGTTTSSLTPTLSSRHSIKRTNSTSNNAALRSIAVDYQSLPTNVKVDLLERSLVQQQQLQPPTTSAEKRMNGISSSSKLNHNNNNNNSNHHADIDMSVVDEVKQQLKRVYVKKLDKYKSMLEKKQEEIQAYEEELSKFQRVPITHRIPPLLTHYTYKEKPEYDRYGQSVYGDDPPTALPRIGEYEMDGWILKEDQWAENGLLSTRNWPMFYYKAN